ncbi:MAG: hypothetical protein KGR99_07695 [Betaproteobacteria bacterium]|nr:hypothetical protein [Betaproteobacteria bacterium]MBU6512178.1 hypothetical protein [Betaproteobacteria bacterium]MDE2151916.1 hypothetical protein [Betaproteobacteria bacterium]
MSEFRHDAPPRAVSRSPHPGRGPVPKWRHRAGRWRCGLALAAACALSACGGGGSAGNAATGGGARGLGAPPAAAADRAYTDPVRYDMGPKASLALAQAIPGAAVSHHRFMVQGHLESYTATTGHLLVRSPETGEVEASMFYTAYTLDGQSAAKRPVSFFWNGGPGSSSIYLHLGGWGPKTLQIDEMNLPSSALSTSPDFRLETNPDTLLGSTDMVFVDPVGTGLSEAVAPNTNQSFEGVDPDARSVLHFIDAWLLANQRQMSPKFLYGESYGGIRTPIVARLMEQQGPLAPQAPVLDGVILNSPVLDYNANCDTRWYNARQPELKTPDGAVAAALSPVSCEGDIPSYLMVHFASTHLNYSIEQASQAADRAMTLAREVWAPAYTSYEATVGSDAFRKAYALPYRASDFPSALQQTFQTLAAASGLSTDDWARAFNMGYLDFGSARLGLSDRQWDRQSRRLDVYNAMVSVPPNAWGYVDFGGRPERWAGASDYFNKAFLAARRSYFSDFLGYRCATPYVITNGGMIRDWNWHHDGDLSTLPQTVSDLKEAIDLGGHLPVMIVHGEQDLMTPFFQTVLNLESAGLRDKVEFRLYPGGHMVYLSRRSHDAYKAALERYFSRVAAGTWTPDAPARSL